MSDKSSDKQLSYLDAGVDIAAGNALIDRIKPAVKKTHRPEVVGGLGGFGGLFALSNKYHEPILVSGTDGVGTKLKLALQLKQHNTIGIDLVAMCVNDIVVTGAEPLFFLDYYATSKLDLDIAEDVINGIAKGCELSGAALIGGETAEMPGIYQGDEFDLAGFAVGVVEKSAMLNPASVSAGDVLIGLASSGPHSNGYSLIRHIIAERNLDLAQSCGDSTLGAALLTPTRIYVKTLLHLVSQFSIHAIAHITGGGLTENIPRVLPPNTTAEISLSSWQPPEVFQLLENAGNIQQAEMLKTFNCGIGMVLAVNATDVEAILAALAKQKETAFVLGTIKSSEQTEARVSYVD